MKEAAPATYAATRGKRVTDLVKADLESLERFDMSAVDRNKLEAWKALVNDTGSMMTSSLCTQDLATSLGATADNISAASTYPTDTSVDVLTQKLTTDLDGADMYSVMAVLATACNFNPVIFLKYPPNYYFKGLGVLNESENVSRRALNSNLSGICAPHALADILTIDNYYASKFANLAGMLDGIKNADGSTLLDSTATVWLNHFSDGLAMNTNNLPIIQAGGGGGYFKTGWTVNVDIQNTGSPTLSQGNSESQCPPGTSDAMFDGLHKGTGTDPSVANAPINKYFYNLMNALGVKADSDGFPAKGGTKEVSQFGYSDLTTDFNGGLGAVAGASIHNPGEYTALKSGS